MSMAVAYHSQKITEFAISINEKHVLTRNFPVVAVKGFEALEVLLVQGIL